MIRSEHLYWTHMLGPVYDLEFISSFLTHSNVEPSKTVERSSYLLNGISYTGKMASLYWTNPQKDKHMNFLTFSLQIYEELTLCLLSYFYTILRTYSKICWWMYLKTLT